MKLVENENQKQLSRWIDKHINLDQKKIIGKAYTGWELKECTYLILSGKVLSYPQTVEYYGVPRRSHSRFAKKILEVLKCTTVQMCKKLMAKGIILDSKIRTIVDAIDKQT